MSGASTGPSSAETRHAREAELVALFAKAPIAIEFGMSLSYDAAGHAWIELPFDPRLTHPLGGVHGGVVATLVDNAGWFAVAARHPGVWIATAEFSTHLLRPVGAIALRARGEEVKSGRRLAVAQMHVETETGEVVALGTEAMWPSKVSSLRGSQRGGAAVIGRV